MQVGEWIGSIWDPFDGQFSLCPPSQSMINIIPLLKNMGFTWSSYDKSCARSDDTSLVACNTFVVSRILRLCIADLKCTTVLACSVWQWVWTSHPLDNGLRCPWGTALNRNIIPGYQEDGVWGLFGERGKSCSAKTELCWNIPAANTVLSRSK